ncbi:hypothetical protein ACFYYR_03160 [Streptomyces sp. NPDC001922]|uniref:hypothetical protein n=1 Tax=Streptomyces sp. NPDC001922 TaxID=3364624 RepID=UPI003695C447
MRLRTVLAGAATAALAPVLVLLGPAGAAEADRPPHDQASRRGPQPYCGDPKSPDFPIETRIHGGPDSYAAGGDWQTWNLDLRNTTTVPCRDVHPVAVLVDHRRSLDRDRIDLEFYDPGQREWRPVTFETTDQDEQIAVFEDGDRFRGFAVPARRTLTVQVRMRFSAETGEDRVRVNVATVQRRADDGDWVGESNDYEFSIRGADGTTGLRPDRPESHEKQHRPSPGPSASDLPERPEPGREPRRESKGNEAQPERPLPAAEAGQELARTGQTSLRWIAAGAGVCLAGGALLLALARRRSR